MTCSCEFKRRKETAYLTDLHGWYLVVVWSCGVSGAGPLFGSFSSKKTACHPGLNKYLMLTNGSFNDDDR